MESIRARNLAKLWSATGAFNLFFTLNTWLTNRGGDDPFGAFLIDKRREIAPLFGILVDAPLLVVTALVGIAYANEIQAGRRAQRIPTIWLEDESQPSRSFAAYKGSLVLLLIVIPAAGLVHFLSQTLGQPVFVDETGLQISVWSHVPFKHNGYSFALKGKGVTFFPFWEPIVLVLFCLIGWLSAGVYLWRILRRQSQVLVDGNRSFS